MIFKLGVVKDLANLKENSCVGVSFDKNAGLSLPNLLKRDSPTQLSSCEICEIFKNMLIDRTPSVAVSDCLRGNFLEYQRHIILGISIIVYKLC